MEATKSSPTDVVTDADVRAERAIREVIRSARPDDGVAGEELGVQDGGAPVQWLVDPIDGTVNFVYGLPLWSISIAALVDNVTVAAVVRAPALNRCYTATFGGGAWCGEHRLRASSCPTLSQALVATGFGYTADRRQEQADALRGVLPRVRDIRRLGSAALDLCLVAAGQVDVYYERGPQDHDWAAGVLIAREAGAVVERRGSLLFACGPVLADVVADVLEEIQA